MNQVRIIGGEWRRQLIKFPDSAGLRPTPDRVRETLFNWLGQDLTGRVCLDLFAGSGALGFEAASRGATRVVMVERDAKVMAALKENARRLKMPATVEFVTTDALKYAVSCKTPFDVLFADPPYRQGWLDRLEPLLDRLLLPDGAFYAEAECPVANLGAWQTTRQGQAGQVYFHLLHLSPPTQQESGVAA
ncbi:MAG: 16S rRNA (guanine(966)-N(2))-methyltransferase RsmD [Zoogloeaceae bacterium]|jgi:16S rRNA (guanine966-N2)-methyltransferase|nr:16S rRNA (guanine(966)-N(2))-methyltransferase RsmD [Zoogloeaceae bacterium]